FTDFPIDSLNYLYELNAKALFFTTRGYLSQSFCKFYKMDNVTFSGDIAFLDSRFANRIFEPVHKIETIAISDPHNSEIFLTSVVALYSGLKKLFPKAEFIFMLHGLNPTIENFCEKEGLRFEKIYLNKENGLDIYDSI